MLLSIVTGSYNRLNYLSRMVASVRSQLPRHIAYEIVVVDGGSKDGTIEWCKSQPDIVLIEHGELRGAIKAFTEGARAARGTYVCLANDDCEFWPNSLLRAVAYLEDYRRCGAVAFADNRSMQLGKATKHQVEGMPARYSNGEPAWVNYAQVGLFRRWLGDKVGWWGADDEIMGQARTYGADNWLSARIWELGYSVDAVDGCAIDDLLARDGLRARNSDTGAADSACYYRAYPYGPQLQPAPLVPNPQHESLRTLVLDIHDPRLPARTAKEYGLAEAFAKVSYCYHVDIANQEFDLPKLVETWQPHLVFTQMHDTSKINASVLSRARAAKPDCVIINWVGDAHERCYLDPEIIEALRYVDLQLVVNAKVLPTYEQLGINAAFWEIGFKEAAQAYQGEVPRHDVLFMGNAYNKERLELVEMLQSLPYDIGLYGNTPGSRGNTHYDFAHQAALYQNATINIGDTFPDTYGYCSNRLIQCLGNGGFLLNQRSEGLQEYTGITPGIHYEEWIDLPDLKAKIAHWLKPEQAAQRRQIAEQGRAFICDNFKYDDQISKLWKLLP